MKKLILILLVLCNYKAYNQIFTYSYVHNQQEDSMFYASENCCLYVDLGNHVVVLPNIKMESTMQAIAYRAVNPLCGVKFEDDFFTNAKKVLKSKYPNADISNLEWWGSIFSNYIVYKGNYDKFVYMTENLYKIDVQIEKDTKRYKIVNIGKVKLKIFTDIDYVYKKKKILIPKDYYYIQEFLE